MDSEKLLAKGGCLEKKPHQVQRATICLDKENGGTGVKDLGYLNKALFPSGSGALPCDKG